MTKKIAEGFETDAPAQQGDRVRVAKAMWPLERDRQATPSDPFLEDIGHGRPLEDTSRRSLAQEQFAMRRRRPSPTQVLEENRPGRIREGQYQRASRLALGHVEPTTAPIDRVEREGDDLARAQAIGGDEKEHGVVAKALTGAAINRLQQGSDHRPRQTAWKLLLPVNARGVDLAVQATADGPTGGEKAEKAPESTDRMLERGSTQALPRSTDEGLHVGDREGGQPLGHELVIEVCEEPLSRGHVLLDGGGRQATEVMERGAVDLCQRPDTSHSGWQRREQGVFLEEAEEPTSGGGRTRIVPTVPPPAHFQVGLPHGLPLPMALAPEITIDPDESTRLLTPRPTPVPLPG
jgi:hypothetical protein